MDGGATQLPIPLLLLLLLLLHGHCVRVDHVSRFEYSFIFLFFLIISFLATLGFCVLLFWSFFSDFFTYLFAEAMGAAILYED